MSFLTRLFENLEIEDIRNILRYALNNLEDLDYSWHPVGFIVLRLGGDDRYKYRVHIWPTGKRVPKDPNWPIHNHVFDIESFVVCGKVINRNYLLNFGANEESNFDLYEVEYYNGGSKISKTSNHVKSVSFSDSFVDANQSYFIPKGNFHESIVDTSNLTCTVVKTTIPEPKDRPLILGKNTGAKIYDCPNVAVSKSYMTEQIFNVIKLINRELATDIMQASS